MFPKPTRLFLIKFLGLWGGTNSQIGFEGDDKKKSSAENFHNIANQTKQAPIESSTSLAKDEAVKAGCKRITALLLEKGIPGLTVCISREGQTIWKSAFGFCDVENQTECEPDAHMRIASISKALFAGTVVAPMIENNKIDIKSSVHNYLSTAEFPKQKFEGKEYDITIEQLLSHTAGIDHYDEGKIENLTLRPIGSKGSKKIYQNDDQFNRVGFYQRRTFRTVLEALEPFKNGPLVKKPGNYKYSTYGYTLLSAVIEKAHQKGEDERCKSEQIEDYWIKVLHRDWNMKETYLDQDEVIISKRSRYYLRLGFNGGLINAPYTDNSVKWAGGGMNSTTEDLVKYGQQLIDCYKGRESARLKRQTIELLWKEVKESYGLGFKITSRREGTTRGNEEDQEFAVYHEGCALGASSILIMYPESEIVIAILANMGEVSLLPLAKSLASEFKKI